MHPRNTRTSRIDGKHAVLIVTLQNNTLAAQKFAPELKSDHDCQEFQDVNVVSKLAGNGARERSVKVLAMEIAPRAGAACVRREEQAVVKPR